MVCNPPRSLPHTCSQPPVVPRVPSPLGVEIAFLAGFHGASLLPVALGYEHGGWRRKCVVRWRGFGELGLGSWGAQQRYSPPSLAKFPYLNEERRRRRYVIIKKRPHQGGRLESRSQFEDYVDGSGEGEPSGESAQAVWGAGSPQ